MTDEISTTQQSVDVDKFNKNFDAIFGNSRARRGSYIQDPVTGKLVERDKYVRPVVDAPMVMPPLAEFKSPIDGSIISSRAKLDAHNKRHGVTNSADYSTTFLENRAKQRVHKSKVEAKASRIDEIKRAMAQYE